MMCPFFISHNFYFRDKRDKQGKLTLVLVHLKPSSALGLHSTPHLWLWPSEKKKYPTNKHESYIIKLYYLKQCLDVQRIKIQNATSHVGEKTKKTSQVILTHCGGLNETHAFLYCSFRVSALVLSAYIRCL